MVNNTRKIKDITMGTLQKLVKKYSITKSGSKKEIALRLWKLRSHIMLMGELKIIEDFLNIPETKRYKALKKKI